MIRLLLVAAILVTFVRPAGAEPAEDLQGLRALMADRLAVMAYVAAFKWNEGLPIDDKAREAKVVRETLARNNIDSDDAAQVTRALKAQIEAAKLVQHALFQKWQAANRGKDGAAPDLQISVRLRISRMSNALIATVLVVQDDLDDCAAQEILAPVPPELAQMPKAWEVAVAGVLDLKHPCPPVD